MQFLEELSKSPLIDSEGQHIGHIQDLGFLFGDSFPKISVIAAHIFEIDHIGKFPLLRPVEDIVLTISAEMTDRFDGEKLHLKSGLAELDVIEFDEEIFFRRDLLNAQILDKEEHRIQRVDDLFTEVVDGKIVFTGILAGFGGMLNRLDLSASARELKDFAHVELAPEMIPWNAVAGCGKFRVPIRLKMAFKD